MRRMDIISYDHSAFGRVRDDYVSNHRGSTPVKWKNLARRSSNETIFKYSVNLLGNIVVIVVGSVREKRRLLDVFRKPGYPGCPTVGRSRTSSWRGDHERVYR